MPDNNDTKNVNVGTSSGISFGAIIAIAISWTKVHSIWWALFHGMLGWMYVFYHLIKRDIW